MAEERRWVKIVRALVQIAVVLLVYLALRWLYGHVRFWLLPDPAAGTPAATVPEGLRDLGDLLEPIRARHKVPALAAAVVTDGRLTALGAVGVRRAGHAEPVTADDCFHIGSCTKSMTATLCAILVEQGKLRWDSTIAEVFADAAPKVPAAWHAVTLEQLLSHRSGLPEDGAPDRSTWPRILALTGPMLDQRRAFVDIVLGNKPAHDPGSKFAYSNAGYVLAGAMCERVAGQTWEDLLREHLFKPLDMTTAGFGPPGRADAVDQPWGHELSWFRLKPLRPGPDADNPAVIGPAGTVHCSLADWAKYAVFHLQGARGAAPLLRPETFRKLHADPEGDGYAFGWLVRRGGKGLAHDGSNTLWYASIMLAPERNQAILAAMNLGTDKAMAACRETMGKLVAEIAGEPRP